MRGIKMEKNNSGDLFTSEDAENEDDVRAADASLLSGVVVTDADWTTETILSQLRKGNILLNPKFQRRDAWNDERKSRFIESLILGLPIPQLVLAEDPKQKGKYVVIDGKQRLLSLLRFAGEHEAPLKLKNLSLRKDLNNFTFQELSTNPAYVADLSAFENATIRTTVVKGWRDEEILYLVFYRLNSGSVPLSPQELRHVLHPGPFIDFAFDFSEASEALVKLLGKDGKPDFRMRDVEVLIRHIAFRKFGRLYQGDLKRFLDDTTQNLNKDWGTLEQEIRAMAKSCEYAINMTLTIFGEDAFSKWTPKGFEPRFNRAVFDVMTQYFWQIDLAVAAELQSDTIKTAFIELCRDNPAFLRALETTTKSSESTRARMQIWGEMLELILGIRPESLDNVPQ
jgi:Protein of unknown function DUF262